MNRIKKYPILALMVTLASACGNQNTEPVTEADTVCSEKVAQIEVGDGFMRALCGCNESSPTPIVAPAPLTCTVAAGTVVLFQYSATTLKHQIVATGARGFAPSPLSNPSDINVVVSHAVQFSEAGSYSFTDTVNAATTGQIIVL